MLKRKSLVIMVLVFAFAVSFMACSNKDNTDQTQQTITSTTTATAQTTTTASQSETEAVTEPLLPIVDPGSVTLRYAGAESLYAPVSLASNLPVWEEIENRTGVKIEWEVVPSGQYDTTMQVRLAAARDIPDIFQVPGDILKYSSEGLLLEISGLIEEYAPSITKLWERLPIAKMAQITPDGDIYSICLITEGAAEFVLRTPLIRKDFLENFNLEIPKTLDDWYDVLKAFKENGVEVPLTDWQGGGYWNFRQAFGLYTSYSEYGMFVDKDGKVAYPYITPQYKEFVTYMNKLYKDGLMDKEVYQPDLNAANSMVTKNMVGAVSFNNNLDTYWNNLLEQSGIEGEYIFIEQPTGYDGSAPSYVKQALARAKYSISASTKHQEVAVRWLDFLFSDEGTILQNFGIEGKSFEMVDNKPVLSEWVTNNQEGLDIISSLRSLGAYQQTPRLDSVDLTLQMTNPAIVEFSQSIKQNVRDPFPSIISTTEESDIIVQAMGDIHTYAQEMEMQFIIGTRNINEFDAFVTTIKGMGIDDVLAIKQAQYDRVSGK